MHGPLKPIPPERVLLTADAVGGVLTVVEELARSLAARGVAVDVAFVGPSPDPRTRLSLGAVEGVRAIDTGLPLEWMAESAGPVLEAARRLAELADDLAPDVVHLSNPAHAAAGDWRAPLVVTLHSCMATWWRAVKPDVVPPPALGWRTRLTRAGLAAADAAIAPSAAFADAARAVYGGATFHAVPNGRTMPAGPPPAPTSVRRGAAIAGRLWDEAKNVAAVDAAARTTRVPVHAAGPLEGPNGAAVRVRHLHALGRLSPQHMREVLASCRTFVSPAFYEPFGLTVLEAAQAGCALVLSDIPTFRSLWEGAAEFVDPADPAAIAAAIERLAANDDLATALGAAARRRAAGMTAEAMTEATLGVYARARRVASARLLDIGRGVA